MANDSCFPKQFNCLVHAVSSLAGVEAVGLSGDDRPLPRPGEGDLDIFIYCSEIPYPEQRLIAYRSLIAYKSSIDCSLLSPEGQLITVDRPPDPYWGQADSLFLDGVETWLMYFLTSETCRELEGILAGNHPDREAGDFYPLGRLAMFQTMRALYDPFGLLAVIQQRLIPYPEALRDQLLSSHLGGLADLEDLERAARRRDVLFFHFALDRALDHFLQALFALNRAYFPSRKRSPEYIDRFSLAPADCTRRLLDIVEAGAHADTLKRALAAWLDLAAELKALATSQGLKA